MRQMRSRSVVGSRSKAGSDQINLGSSSNGLDPIIGPLTVNGQAGGDALNFNDQGTIDVQTYTLSASALNRTGLAAIFRGVVIGDDLKFLDRLRARQLSGCGLRVTGKIRVAHAIEQIDVLVAA